MFIELGLLIKVILCVFSRTEIHNFFLNKTLTPIGLKCRPVLYLKSQKKPKLLDRVREIIRLRHYSLRTEQVYIHWIRSFILFHRKLSCGDAGSRHRPISPHLAVSRAARLTGLVLSALRVLGGSTEAEGSRKN